MSISKPPKIEMLDENLILSYLEPDSTRLLNQLIVLGKTQSTNSHLLSVCDQSGQSGMVCVAESQTKGRGRRGKTWVSPAGHNVYLSMSWRFEAQQQELSGLSLAIGLAVIRALKDFQLSNLSIKWPNDIYSGDKKLAGILIDVVWTDENHCLVVAGIGLNRWIDAASSGLIDQDWVDLFILMGLKMPSRNRLVASIIGHLIEVMLQFEVDGFSGFCDEWKQWDYLVGRQIILSTGQQQVNGIACGVNSAGLLVIEDSEQQQHLYSIGEVVLTRQ